MITHTLSTDDSRRALGLDLGGTKIAGGIVDTDGRVLARRHERWRSTKAEDLLAQTIGMATEMSAAAEAPLAGVGVGVPAVIDRDGVIECAPNLAGLNGLALRQRLHEHLNLPCWVGHDGQMAALGEYRFGAGQGTTSFACVVVGTGIGGGLILDGKVYGGASGLAAAGLGWVVPDRESLSNTADTDDGALESRASGRGLAERVRDLVAAEPDSSLGRLAADLPDSLTAQAVFRAADGGDRAAIGLVREAGDLVGILVANLVTILNPEVVALGGTIGLQAVMLERVRAVTQAHAMPRCRQTTSIVAAKLGGDAGLVGAAYQVFAAHQSRGRHQAS